MKLLRYGPAGGEQPGLLDAQRRIRPQLGVVIGPTTRCVHESAALEHVAGYVVVNDVSEREYQIERGGTWDKGKGCDTFGPVGSWLVTGTPPGVGMGRKPAPLYLKPGDAMRLGVEKLGEQQQNVIAWRCIDH